MKDITQRIDELLAGFMAFSVMNNKIGGSTGALDIGLESAMKKVVWDPLYPKRGWKSALEKVSKEEGFSKDTIKKLEKYFKKYGRQG